MLVVTDAVAVVGVIGRWSMLTIAVAIHAATTVVVFVTILYVSSGGDGASAPGEHRGRKVMPERAGGMQTGNERRIWRASSSRSDVPLRAIGPRNGTSEPFPRGLSAGCRKAPI